jgi:hypothetical protein
MANQNPGAYDAAARLFTAEFIAQIFKDNSFLEMSRDWSEYTKAAFVNYTESVGVAGYIVDRAAASLAAVIKDDLNRSYKLSGFQSIPTALAWTNEMTVNYNKRAETIKEHLSTIADGIALEMIFNWFPKVANSGAILASTGAARSTGIGSGTRKRITFDDLRRAMAILDRQGVPAMGRVIVGSPSLEDDLLKIEQFISRDYVTNEAISKSSFGTILNAQIFKRASTVWANNFTADNGAEIVQPKLRDTLAMVAPQANSCEAVLIYHPDFVTRSISPDSKTNIIDVHGGTEISFTTLAGGRALYGDFKGVIGIVETFVS